MSSPGFGRRSTQSDPGRRPSGSGPVLLASAIAVALVIVAVGCVALLQKRSSPSVDVDEIRQKAIAFTTAKPTTRYTGEATFNGQEVDLGGEIVLPDDERYADEVGQRWLLVGDQAFYVDEATSQKWTDLADLDLGTDGFLAVTVSVTPYAHWLDEMLALDDLEVIDTTSSTAVLGGAVPPLAWEVPERFDDNTTPPLEYDVEIELRHDGEPRSMTLQGETDEGDQIVYRFEYADWGAPITVEPPSADEIEHTPWLSESVLEEVRDDFVAVGPSSPPPGTQLLTVDAIPDDRTVEECPQIQVRYGLPEFVNPLFDGVEDDPIFTYFLLPFACAVDADDEPFEVGAFGDLAARQVGGSWEVRVGETVVQITTTSFDDGEIADILATFGPIDLDAAVVTATANFETAKAGG